ncbi:MAG: histidine kinase [Roseburia sp.]|nr:histidine kinase [Roseburia sp.]
MRSVKPIQNLLQLFQNSETDLAQEIYNDREIRYIADRITSYIQQNQALTDELNIRLNLLNQTKLLALQSQINPHFLFNTLNMIHIQESEALGYEHRIPAMTLSLSKLLRYAIESTDLVTLETEIHFTRMYINLLKERYNNKLHIVYDIESSTFHAKVPKLIFQPLIENAIFHGLAEHMTEDSSLTLSCHRKDNFIVVSIKDNGIGMSPDTLAHLKDELKESVPLQNSIGIKNVVTRMNLLYGEEFSITIDSAPGKGSVFTLHFPSMQ